MKSTAGFNSARTLSKDKLSHTMPSLACLRCGRCDLRNAHTLKHGCVEREHHVFRLRKPVLYRHFAQRSGSRDALHHRP